MERKKEVDEGHAADGKGQKTKRTEYQKRKLLVSLARVFSFVSLLLICFITRTIMPRLVHQEVLIIHPSSIKTIRTMTLYCLAHHPCASSLARPEYNTLYRYKLRLPNSKTLSDARK